MASSRRTFIKKGAAITALSTLGFEKGIGSPLKVAKEGNITLCLAYFFGIQERKMELSKQMGVTGVVSPSSPGIAGLHHARPWSTNHL